MTVCYNWSIVGSVWPLHGPGRQRSHASAGQPGRTENEDQLGPTTSHPGPCCRRTFRRTRQTNQMCSTNSLRLRRRHHGLFGDPSPPSLGPPGRDPLGERACEWTSGWAGVTWSVQSDRREQRAWRFLSCSGEACERFCAKIVTGQAQQQSCNDIFGLCR